LHLKILAPKQKFFILIDFVLKIRGRLTHRILIILALAIVLASNAAHGADYLKESQQRVVCASEILGKIVRSEAVYYDNVIIKGDIDLNNIKNNKKFNITTPITITRSQIDGRINLSTAIFSKTISFNGSQFMDDVNFSKSKFSDAVSFIDSQFKGNAYFNESHFVGFAHFNDVQFSGYSKFSKSQFNKDVDFRNVKFDNLAWFLESKFEEDANFRGSIFLDAFFSGSLFQGDAQFIDSKFIYGADFGETRFDGDADFLRSQFENDAYFTESQFNGNANFIKSQFKGDARFTGCRFFVAEFIKTKFTGTGVVDFWNSEFIRYADFRDSRFEGPLLYWASIKSQTFDESTYLAIIKNFKDNGNFDEADECYYQYRLEKMHSHFRSSFSFSEFFLGMLSLVTSGYGVHLINTIFCAIFILFIFGLQFSRYVVVDWDLKEALVLSAMILLSLPLDWRSSKRNYTKLVEDHLFLVTLERLIGWGLLIILIGTFSRITIRY